MEYKCSMELGGRTLTLETGRLARQASGSVLVTYGDTVVLAASVVGRKPTDRDFLPLTVDYREKTYAAGRIPGGFFKREGRPNEKEILSSRLIDRSLRPLFEKSIRFETMITAEVLSSDQENDGDTLGLIGASCALNLSDLPFPGPVGAVRIGLTEEGFVINPTSAVLEASRMNIIAAGTEDSIVMVEGEAREISEDQLIEAFRFAHPHIQRIVQLQKQVLEAVHRPKRAWAPEPEDEALYEAVRGLASEKINDAIRVAEKHDREERLDAVEAEVQAALLESHPEREKDIAEAYHRLVKKQMRSMVLDEGVRCDGRRGNEIRPITCEVGVLPRTHGSAIFTRGQT